MTRSEWRRQVLAGRATCTRCKRTVSGQAWLVEPDGVRHAMCQPIPPIPGVPLPVPLAA